MKKHIVVSYLVVAGSLLGCGSKNIYHSFAKKKQLTADQQKKQDAVDAIKNQDWTKAEANLQEILAKDPTNTEAKSMLGNVYMKKTGLDTLTFSKKVTDTADAKGTINVPTLIKNLPEANTQNVDALKASVQTFEQIPVADLNPTQKLQKAMAQFSYAMVLTKATSTDDSGTYDKSKADSSLSASAADDIVADMDKAALTIGDIGGADNAKGASKIAKTTDSIKGQPGTDNADKLKAYLEAESAKK